MRVLVTGGTGFLGSRLCRRLAAEGHDVRVLVRSGSQYEGPGTVIRGDITDSPSLDAAVHDREWVVHAAADLNHWRQDRARQFQVNVDGTRNVARACRLAGVKRMLHVSSVAAIGIPDSEQPADEQFRFNLEASGLDYHVSKHEAECALLEEVKLGLHAVIVNPASITAPERLARLLNNVRSHPVTPCFSGGNCVVHVDDVIGGIMSALASGAAGQRYILGGENLTFRAMAEKAAKALNLSRRLVAIPAMVTGFAAAALEPLARTRKRPPAISYMMHYCANRFLYYDSIKAGRELNYSARSFECILQEAIGDSLAQ